MNIRGIDNLKGFPMESNEPQGEPTPAQPTETTPAPPVPAHEETANVTPSAPDEDVAPDADEPGDEELPEELQQDVHEGAVPQDNVDQEG